jgi:hypothetical protein
LTLLLFFRYGEGEDEASSSTSKTKVNITETMSSDDSKMNISNVTNVVAGKLNMFGKSVGGLGSKLGGGGWF